MERLSTQMAELAVRFEKASLAELIELYRHPWRMFCLNLLAGVFRGFGIAVGFTAVGATFLYILGRLAALNLPVIGHFVAEIARIVEIELSIPQ